MEEDPAKISRHKFTIFLHGRQNKMTK